MALYFRWLPPLIKGGGGGGGRGRTCAKDLDGTDVSLYFRLEFSFSNNVAKYEAMVIGFISALQMRFKSFKCKET